MLCQKWAFRLRHPPKMVMLRSVAKSPEYSEMAVSPETSSKKQLFEELVLRCPRSKIAISLETSSKNQDVEGALLLASSWNAPKGLRNCRIQFQNMPQRTPRPPNHTPKEPFIILIIILSTIVITIIIIIIIIIIVVVVIIIIILIMIRSSSSSWPSSASAPSSHHVQRYCHRSLPHGTQYTAHATHRTEHVRHH